MKQIDIIRDYDGSPGIYKHYIDTAQLLCYTDNDIDEEVIINGKEKQYIQTRQDCKFRRESIKKLWLRFQYQIRRKAR